MGIVSSQWHLTNKDTLVQLGCQHSCIDQPLPLRMKRFFSRRAKGISKYHLSLAENESTLHLLYSFLISSLISASQIFWDASSTALCKTALRCYHISCAKLHSSRIAHWVQALPLSFFGSRRRWAAIARHQCWLRYPRIPRSHPIWSCSYSSSTSKSCCLMGTSLISVWWGLH